MGCAVVAAGPNIASGAKGCWVRGGRSSEGRLVAVDVDADNGGDGVDEGTAGGRRGVVVGSGCSIAAPAALAKNASILGDVAADVGPVGTVGTGDAGGVGVDSDGEVDIGVGGAAMGDGAVMGGGAAADGG